MTSGTPFPRNLTAVDQLTQPDHTYLSPEDKCYFLGEYTARKGFAYSETNSLILNLKKKPDRRGRPEWQYKDRAILTAAKALQISIKDEWLRGATFVPIPPSKAKTDPLYDDRMTRVLKAIDRHNPVDCRELIVQTETTEAVHEAEVRLGPAEIRELYVLDQDLLEPRPDQIVICDDVLTTGAHFRAAQSVLCDEFPNALVVGCFISRRAPEAIDIEEFFDNLDD